MKEQNEARESGFFHADLTTETNEHKEEVWQDVLISRRRMTKSQTRPRIAHKSQAYRSNNQDKIDSPERDEVSSIRRDVCLHSVDIGINLKLQGKVPTTVSLKSEMLDRPIYYYW